MKIFTVFQRLLKIFLVFVIPGTFLYAEKIHTSPSSTLKPVQIITSPHLPTNDKIDLLEVTVERKLSAEDFDTILGYFSKCDYKLLAPVTQYLLSTSSGKEDREKILERVKFRLIEKPVDIGAHVELLDLFIGISSGKKFMYGSPFASEIAEIIYKNLTIAKNNQKLITDYLVALDKKDIWEIVALAKPDILAIMLLQLEATDTKIKDKIQLLNLINGIELFEFVDFDKNDIEILVKYANHSDQKVSSLARSIIKKAFAVPVGYGKLTPEVISKKTTLREYLKELNSPDATFDEKERIVNRVVLRKLNKKNIALFLEASQKAIDDSTKALYACAIAYYLACDKDFSGENKKLAEDIVVKTMDAVKDERLLLRIASPCFINNEIIDKQIFKIFNKGEFSTFNSTAAAYLLKNKIYRSSVLDYYIQYLKNSKIDEMDKNEKRYLLSFFFEATRKGFNKNGEWITDNNYWLKELKKLKNNSL